jgi:hypothetical protein
MSLLRRWRHGGATTARRGGGCWKGSSFILMVAKVKLHSFYIDLSCYLAAALGRKRRFTYWKTTCFWPTHLLSLKKESSLQYSGCGTTGLVMIPSTSILFVGKQLDHATCCYSLDSFSDSCGRQLPATTSTNNNARFQKIGVRFWGWMVGVCETALVRCAVDFANSQDLWFGVPIPNVVVKKVLEFAWF